MLGVAVLCEHLLCLVQSRECRRVRRKDAEVDLRQNAGPVESFGVIIPIFLSSRRKEVRLLRYPGFRLRFQIINSAMAWVSVQEVDSRWDFFASSH